MWCKGQLSPEACDKEELCLVWQGFCKVGILLDSKVEHRQLGLMLQQAMCYQRWSRTLHTAAATCNSLDRSSHEITYSHNTVEPNSRLMLPYTILALSSQQLVIAEAVTHTSNANAWFAVINLIGNDVTILSHYCFTSEDACTRCTSFTAAAAGTSARWTAT